MQTSPKLRKGLTIGIIFLFIGVAVAPSINNVVVKASNDNDLVEVTSQACGIQGFDDTTVKLTKEQYKDLEQYLVDFRAKLNQTTTREEAVPIFKNAVVELNKYGLLPKGMSVKQAQKLICGPQLSSKQIEHIEGLLKNNRIGRLMVVHNLFCFVNAHTSSGSLNVNLIALGGGLVAAIGGILLVMGYGYYLVQVLGIFLMMLGSGILMYGQYKPFIPANIFVLIYNANYLSFGLLGEKQGTYDLVLLGFTGFEITINSEWNYLGWTVAIYT
jgi:hypothetical protein